MRAIPFAAVTVLIACRPVGASSDADAPARDATVAAPAPDAIARPAHPAPTLPDASATDPVALVADLAARVADAGPARTHVEVGAFVFVPVGSDRLFTPAVEVARRSIEALGRRFDRAPSRGVTVFVFSETAAYHAFCRARYDDGCDDQLGLYERTPREIVVDASPGLHTLTHEIIHPFVEADFPMAPLWLDEGLGTLFEAPAFARPGEIHGLPNWRGERLKEALRAGRPEARMDRLFGMTHDAFLRGDRLLSYAVARYTCLWLDRKGALWAFYRAYKEGFWGDVDGDKAFRAATGQSPQEAEGAWVAWVTGL